MQVFFKVEQDGIEIEKRIVVNPNTIFKLNYEGLVIETMPRQRKACNLQAGDIIATPYGLLPVTRLVLDVENPI
jgi:hypothetical protein